MTVIAFVPISARELDDWQLTLRAAAGFGVSAAFTLLARALHGVTVSGAVVGLIGSFLVYLSAGPSIFIVLVSVFVLTAATTRFGYASKKALGVAESTGGRAAGQVLANTAAATIAVVLFGWTANPAFLVAGCAALAEAAADTVASEVGEALSSTARLITTGKPVPPGTDGGVSVPGTFAGIVASGIIAAVSALVGLVTVRAATIVVVAAVFGMVFDSILGGCLEQRKLVTNNAVNFFSTTAAALLALALIHMHL
jgi:uncharacterized protein (TIGR00297 family)